MEDLKEITKIAKDILGSNVSVYKLFSGQVSISAESDLFWSYDDLKKLSERLGTTDINIEYTESTPDWSEVTPGESSRCSIVVDWPKDDK